MDDLGERSSYLTLEVGTPVYASDGERIGAVEHVLADADQDIFDGIVLGHALIAAVALVRPRLLWLALAVSLLAGLLASSEAQAKAKGFRYGVTAAEVTSSSAILWARAGQPGNVVIQARQGRSGNFGGCRAKRVPDKRKLKAKRSNDLTIQKRVRGLKADKRYRYRFCRRNGDHSATGRFETAPKKKQRKTIRFALSGDQDARPLPGETTPYWNSFQVWDRIRQQRNDFNVLMGDSMYSDTEVPGYEKKDIALTVEEKWDAYKLNLRQKRWPKARGSAAYYGHWDDHEFINDFSHFENRFPESNDGNDLGDVRIDGDKLYDRSVRAFRDYNPVTYSDRNGIYRSQRWGKNLEVFFLDERSFRSSSADYNGVCDNPQSSDDPDLAPTAPQSTRNAFSVIAPSLANPPPPGCVEAINDPDRTMLGTRQLRRFKQAIEDSDATFKVIFNEVPIQQYYALPYDRWEGYEAERKHVLRFLSNNVDNAVFLTTDVHANLVNDARFNTLGGPGVQNSGILDITTGPIATESYSGEIEGATGNESAGALVQAAFFKPQPPAGLGMQCASTDQFSYAEVEVTAQALTVDLLDINDDPVKDTGDSTQPAPPCNQVVIPAE